MTRSELKEIIKETMIEMENEKSLNSLHESYNNLDHNTQELLTVYCESVLREYDEYLVLEKKNPERFACHMNGRMSMSKTAASYISRHQYCNKNCNIDACFSSLRQIE